MTLACYASANPQALWQAGGPTALHIAGLGAAGYATRLDLTRYGLPSMAGVGIRIQDDASDLLLGPYSTVLMRAADDMAAKAGWLVRNHGGSGDDVERLTPVMSCRY
jgi:hypothetical protein